MSDLTVTAGDEFDMIAAAIARHEAPDGVQAAGWFGNGTLAGVLRGLVGSGVKFSSALAWLPVILQLITELGPKVAEIIEAIKKAIADGRTPQTFHAA